MQNQKSETALIRLRPETDPVVAATHAQTLNLRAYAERRVIVTPEGLRLATEDLSLISRLKKALEDKRKEYVGPLQSHVQAINATFKTLMEPIEAADQLTRGKMLKYQAEQARIREEQEEINRLRMEAARKEAALHEGEISEPVNLVEVMPEVAKKIDTKVGSAGQRTIRKWEVVDKSLVPEDLKVIDAGAVTKLVKAGIGAIAGIRIYEEVILAVRPR